MDIHVLTLYPEILPGPLAFGIVGRALRGNLWNLKVHNIRDYSLNSHKSVDGKPLGGGAGMILRPDVVGNALESIIAKMKSPTLIYTTPAGKRFSQKNAKEFSSSKELLILCGRFEGIDQRILEVYPFQEFSMGDFILSGGEIFAIAMIESTVRLLPGAMGNQESETEESFSEHFPLEYPQYTKPTEWKDLKAPKVLTSGNHKLIEEWRRQHSVLMTKKRRSDLLSNHKKNNAKAGRIV